MAQETAMHTPDDGTEAGKVPQYTPAGEQETMGITRQRVEAMYGLTAVQAAVQQEKQAAAEMDAQTERSIRILDKEAFKLGDLNPLTHPADLKRDDSVEAIKCIAVEKITQYEGLMPKIMDSTIVIDTEGNTDLRFIARFEVPVMSEQQIELLEELVKQTYGESARTRTDRQDNDIPTESYPPTQPGEEMKSKTGGWYMGSAPFPTSSLYEGLFIFKDYGPITRRNFLDDNQTPRKYIVEIREASQYQTDLVTLITQVSAILRQDNPELIDRGKLLYETYYDLIRLSLKKPEEESIYGMEKAADMIRRELIIPLANPEISDAINEAPQSVLMVGVPGTGKTLLVERLLQEDTDLFVLPIDPFELQKEVALPKEKQRLMPRIAEIARVTGKQVILHVDDIENMVGQEAVTNSTMLNLMAGVQESGFYIIASTNYPEKINESLIQPQRFSVLIHCGLQNEEARREILKIHADKASKKLGVPLFRSDEIRDLILDDVAKHTKAFTPRYLANVATIAKSHLLDRIAKAKGKTVGLNEEDLEGFAFEVEDWDKALIEVAAKYDNKTVERRDQELAEFVRKQSRQTSGFGSSSDSGYNPQGLISQDTYKRVATANAHLQESGQATE